MRHIRWTIVIATILVVMLAIPVGTIRAADNTPLGAVEERFVNVFESLRGIFASLGNALAGSLASVLGSTTDKAPLPDRDALSSDTVSFLNALNAFEKAAPEGKERAQERLAAIAEARRTLLLDLFAIDPEGVLANALSSEARTRVPSDVRSLVEERRSVRGVFEHLHWDNFDEGVSADEYYVTENGTDKRFRVHTIGIPPALTGDTVQADGVVLEDQIAVLENDVTVTAAAGASAASTVKKIIVILFNFQNDTRTPFTPEQVRNTTFTGDPSANTFYQENSFGQWELQGKINTDGDIYGWYTIPYDNTGCTYGTWSTAANALAQADGADFSGYDIRMYAFPRVSECGWSGRGTIGGFPAKSWINGSYSLRTVGHEIGHNFTLHHANTINCVNASGTRVSISDDCYDDEYGDPFGILGSAGTEHVSNYNKRLSADPLAPNWFGPENSIILTPETAPDGVYELTPMEWQSSGLQDIVIPRPYTYKNNGPDGYNVNLSDGHYHIEFRQPYGFDNFFPEVPVVNGVSIRLGRDIYSWKSELVDTTPSTATFTDAALLSGRTYVDAAHGINITTLSVSPSSAQVRVTFGTLPCTRGNPTLTLSPATQSVYKGQSAVYTYTLTNNDTDSCGPSTFALSPSLPAGWSQSPLSPTHSLIPGGSVTGSVIVTSASDAVQGTYTITETGENTSETSYQSSASASLVILADDTTPPVVVINEPADGTVVSKGKLRVKGTASDASGIAEMRIYVDDDLVYTCYSTSCTTNISVSSLSAGDHVIRVEADDNGGPTPNTAVASVIVTKSGSGGGGGGGSGGGGGQGQGGGKP